MFNNSSINKKYAELASTEFAAVTVYLVISLLSVFSNVAVLCLYCSRLAALLKKPANRILISLAVCDIFTPLGLIMITMNFLVPKMDISYRIVIDVYEDFFVKCLIFHLCGLTLDRYIALFHALRYNAIMTNKNVARYIVISWLIPLIASSAQFTWLHQIIAWGTVSKESDIRVSQLDFWFSLLSFVIFLALPMIFMATVFIAMTVEIQRINQNTPGRALQTKSKNLNEESCSTYVFGAMYLIFLMLAMPYYTLRLRNDIYNYMNRNGVLTNLTQIYRFVVGAKYLTSVIRPYLYVFTTIDIRPCFFFHGKESVVSQTMKKRVYKEHSYCSSALLVKLGSNSKNISAYV